MPFIKMAWFREGDMSTENAAAAPIPTRLSILGTVAGLMVDHPEALGGGGFIAIQAFLMKIANAPLPVLQALAEVMALHIQNCGTSQSVPRGRQPEWIADFHPEA